MKILHLSNVFNNKNGGGIHEVVSNLSLYQKRLLHYPEIMAPKNNDQKEQTYNNINIRQLKIIGPQKFSFPINILGKLPKYLTEFQILHQHGVWMPVSLYSRKISRATRIPKIIQPHGLLEPYKIENISPVKKKIVFNLVERFNLAESAALIACSEVEAKSLKKLFPNNEIAIIPNGVNPLLTQYFTPSKNKLSKKRMLFLSQIIPIKGLERLLCVLERLAYNEKIAEWEVLIAGYGSSDYIFSLMQLSKKLNIEGIVKFIGPKYADEKIELLGSSDLLVLPTFSENFGLVIAEALALGIPVLTTKGAPWQQLTTYGCGFWVDNDEDGLFNGILKVLSLEKKELEKMGKKGRDLVLDRYTWDKVASKTIELYEWILYKNQKPNFIL